MTSLIKIHDIPGGVHPPENKAQSLALPLAKAALPPQLVIPLSQHIGEPATPVVHVGERVLAGQLIGTAKGVFSANVHASSSGTVVAVEDRMLTHPSGMSGTCVVIDTDGKDEWVSLQPCADYHSLDKAAMLAKIRAAGIAGLGGAGFPTDIKLNPRSNEVIDTLIINGAECEPYITADDILMQTRADEIIAGTLMIAFLLHEPKQLLIGVEDNKPQAIAALEKAAQGTRIQVVSFPTKYPSGGAKQLIQILTGREVPTDHHSAYIGVICQNVATVAAAYRAVRYGEPLISRVTTLTGEALKVQQNVEALIGTPIDFLLEQHGFESKRATRLIMGGPMMGFTLPEPSVPVIKTTNCILAPSKKEMPAPMPAQACIRCGLCDEACPASLLPQQLFWYAQAEDHERLQAHNLFDCIECGACSYVCPSSIPLVQYYRAAKGTIRLHEIEKEKSDRSRRRFEFRQQRIAKEEAEKEAKRLARKQAAEEAKLKLAEKAKAEPQALAQPQASAQAQVVVDAVAKASLVQQSPDEQKAKLERILAAAKNSLENASKPLVPNEEGAVITPEQLEKQQARIKQAELKVSEAERKFAEFTQAQTATPPSAGDPADPVAAAIARAQAKMAMAPDEKLRSTLESLKTRLAKAQEKASAAKAEGSSTADALQQGVEKLQQKIADTEAELASLGVPAVAPEASVETPPAEQDAASAAIERAKAKAAALANMSDTEKRAEQLQSLEKRLQKARERLAKAEADNDPNIDAFRNGVEKLEEKKGELLAASH